MGKSSQYNHSMQRVDERGHTPFNIEERFPGLLYMKASGLNDIGKPKNIYTENYADSDRMRVYLPPNDNYTHESTTITMTFLIVGDAESRQITLEQFLEEITTGIHRYWDDARNREFDFVVNDEIKVSDERWHGSQPYVEITVPMLNLNGGTRVHQNSAN